MGGETEVGWGTGGTCPHKVLCGEGGEGSVPPQNVTAAGACGHPISEDVTYVSKSASLSPH